MASSVSSTLTGRVGRSERKADHAHHEDRRANEQPARERDVNRVDTDGRATQFARDVTGPFHVDLLGVGPQDRMVDVTR